MDECIRMFAGKTLTMSSTSYVYIHQMSTIAAQAHVII